MTIDKRQYPRLELRRPVTVMIPARCMLSDISRRGARLSVEDTGSLPDRFVLELKDGLLQWCEVVWRTDTEVGVKYINAPKGYRSEDEQTAAALAEYERLEAVRRALARDGVTVDSQLELFGVAKDISFGKCPAIQGVGESLCKLVKHGLRGGRVPVGLVDHHVDAVRAIIREHARGDHPGLAQELIEALHRLTDKFVAPAAAA